jgi:hypothetical protein
MRLNAGFLRMTPGSRALGAPIFGFFEAARHCFVAPTGLADRASGAVDARSTKRGQRERWGRRERRTRIPN